MLALLFLSACGGSPPPPDTTPHPGPQTAAPAPEPEPGPEPLELDAGEIQVRFLHLAGALADKSFEAFVGADASIPTFPRLPFEAAAPYSTVKNVAEGIPIRVRGEGVAEVTGSIQGGPGSYHTVVILSDPSDAAKIQLVPLGDNAPRPSGDAARARFFHALAGTGPVDVCTAGPNRGDPQTALFFGVAYGASSGDHMDLPGTPPVRLQVRAASQEACTGRSLGVIVVAPPEGTTIDRQNITLFGVSRGSGRRATRDVYVSIDQPPLSGFFNLPFPAR